MSTFMFEVASIQPGAGTADNASLTASTYLALQGGTSTQSNWLDEVYMGGLGTSSAPMVMLIGRSSTVQATPTALATPNSNGLLNPSGGVLTAPASAAITASTQSIRSNSVSLGKLTFSFNAFAGIVRCNYANTQDRFGILGNTASLGELTLSSFTGSTASTAISAHLIYETA